MPQWCTSDGWLLTCQMRARASGEPRSTRATRSPRSRSHLAPFAQVNAMIGRNQPVIPKLRSSCTGPDSLSNVSIPAAMPSPMCGGSLTSGGMVLSKREEDSQRVCRVLFRCEDRHVWGGGPTTRPTSWNPARIRNSSDTDVAQPRPQSGAASVAVRLIQRDSRPFRRDQEPSSNRWPTARERR